MEKMTASASPYHGEERGEKISRKVNECEREGGKIRQDGRGTEEEEGRRWIFEGQRRMDKAREGEKEKGGMHSWAS